MARRIVDWEDRIGRRLKLRDLRVLSGVAEKGSMAKAASQLNMTQPAVSQAIADLEAALEVRLLDRGPHGVSLTPYGETMLKHGLEALDAIKQGAREIEFLLAPGAGEVWVGCSESFLAGGLLAEVIRRVAEQHPHIKVHVLEANTAEMEFKELRDRKVDLMIGRMAGPVRDDDLAADVLFKEPIVAVVGGSHPLARRRAIKLDELIEERWVLAPPNTAVRDLVGDAFRAKGFPAPSPSLTTYSMLLRLQMLASGKYITAFPRSLVDYNAKRWSLNILPFDLGKGLPVAVVTLKHRTLSPPVRLFIEHARAASKAALTDRD
jgi:DNA-binding transcriptional LysR family regulator